MSVDGGHRANVPLRDIVNLARVASQPHNVILADDVHSTAELSMGLFCVTRSNPTRQLTDQTQPNPLQVGKIGPNPTQYN